MELAETLLVIHILFAFARTSFSMKKIAEHGGL